jgi:hypothetical protein
MFGHRQHSIRIGDRVRSYDLPGVSSSDYFTGTVIGSCTLAGLPRFIIESVSLTIHGQEEPCHRVFYAPAQCVVNEQDSTRLPAGLHRVA